MSLRLKKILISLPLYFAVIVFSVGAGYGVLSMVKYRSVERELSRNGAWAAFQMQLERTRLLSAIDAFRAGEISVDDLRDRFDILWSRIPILLQGEEGVGARINLKGVEAVRRLESRLKSVEHVLDELDNGDLDHLSALRSAVSPDDEVFQQMVWSAVTQQGDGEGRLSDIRTHIVLGLVLGGAGGILMIGLLGHDKGVKMRLAQAAEDERARAIAANTRLEEAIEAFTDGFALFDGEDRLLVCNERYKTMYAGVEGLLKPGVTFTQILEAALRNGVFYVDPEHATEFLTTRLADHAGSSSRNIQALQSKRWIESREWRTRDGGSVGVYIDITDAKKREKEIIEAMEFAELANRTKSEFLANMSHELRTPLNAILGFSEMMQMEMFGPLGDATYKEYTDDIHRSGKHLLDVINDILDLSKIEAGRMELQESPVDLCRVTHVCLTLVRERASNKQVTLIKEVPKFLPLLADEVRLKQAVLNLLSNAVKFTQQGGTVTLSIFNRDDDLVVQVKDTGIGMKAEDIPRVMKPFEQADGSLARQHEGTGLGLSITKSLIEMHGGTLEIDSELNVGTTARLIIPASRLIVSDSIGEIS